MECVLSRHKIVADASSLWIQIESEVFITVELSQESHKYSSECLLIPTALNQSLIVLTSIA